MGGFLLGNGFSRLELGAPPPAERSLFCAAGKPAAGKLKSSVLDEAFSGSLSPAAEA
jgi:hypothetical protein